MKKILAASWIILGVLFSWTTFASDNNEIIDSLEKTSSVSDWSFQLKTFRSCQEMEQVLWDYMEKYARSSNRNYFGWWPIMVDDMMMESDLALSDEAASDVSGKATVSAQSDWDSSNFSETNTQVQWVDEADIVKTDGTTTYYYNSKKRAVFIMNNSQVLKKINLPKSFSSAELYIGDGKLTIISNSYSQTNFLTQGYYINRNSKTNTMVFDVSNTSEPKLQKLYSSDGNYSKSRKIGDYVYVLTTNYLNIPYYSNQKESPILDASKLLPRQTDISRVESVAVWNVGTDWKKLPFLAKSSQVANCSEVEYILPDEDTIEKYSFNPSYNIVSIIDTKNINAKVETKVIAWNNAEVYMSTKNMYLTSAQYFSNPVACPFNARCLSQFYETGESTLIHKLAVNKNSLDYQVSNVIPWQPLTQYSMDEKDENFRIVTQKFYPERESWVYILDKELEQIWKLDWLGKTEDFKSSRFIGDKLFLVTFEQVDPLFAIDLSDSTNPKILWELKIPGYSSYLHPYDENHLIGLGQSTEENTWWGISNWGLKVDLYKINYDKQCGDTNLSEDEIAKCKSWDYKWIIVEQLYTNTLWGRWSYSEVLYNPRAFVWNESKKLLLLPANIYQNEDETNEYRNTDFFQWVSVIEIDKDKWIIEKWRITHIDTAWLEEERAQECSKYTSQPTEPVCKKLIGGGEYCWEGNSQYVPPYCFEDSKIEEYIANQSYKFSDSYVKRALYIGDEILSFSDNELRFNDINTLVEQWKVEMK